MGALIVHPNARERFADRQAAVLAYARAASLAAKAELAPPRIEMPEAQAECDRAHRGLPGLRRRLRELVRPVVWFARVALLPFIVVLAGFSGLWALILVVL